MSHYIVAKCKIFINCSKNFIQICKKINDCQKGNTQGIIDVKEQKWLTNVKYLRLLFNTSWVFVFCIDTYVNTILKVISINKEKEICLPNKEKKSGHGWE